MRNPKIIFITITLFCLGHYSGIAQETSDTSDVTKQILAGIEAYKQTGADSAWQIWNKDANFPAAGERGEDKFLLAVAQIENNYGKMVKFELIKQIYIGSSYCKIYYLWGFERRPVFMGFACYRIKDQWKLIEFGLSASAPDVLGH
jgi:hypothetical protein